MRQFFQQPRLALAWILSVGHSVWWNAFYIYMPIFAVASGLGKEAGGLISSFGSLGLYTVTFWGWVGRRKYSLVARIRLRGHQLDIDSRRYFDVVAFDR